MNPSKASRTARRDRRARLVCLMGVKHKLNGGDFAQMEKFRPAARDQGKRFRERQKRGAERSKGGQ